MKFPAYEFKGKETLPLWLDEEINLLVQESIKAASEVVKPKKEEKHPMIDEALINQFTSGIIGEPS